MEKVEVLQTKKLSLFVSNRVFIKRSLLQSTRNIEVLITSIMLPIMLMLMFTYVFGGAIDPSGQYVNYVVPGIILLCAAFGSSSTAVDISTDMTNGIMDRFRTMPIQSSGVITGHVVASLLRNLLATGIVIFVAFMVGYEPNCTFTEWISAIGIIVLFILAFTWLFAAIGLLVSSPSAASGYGFILLFLPYLSSAFVPTSTMPKWLRGIAENQPITPLTETIRNLLNGGNVKNDIWWAIGWCLFILVGSFIWSNWLFHRKSGRR
ncbi:ABC transporter permease [Gottfriedia sp. NPDC056225]|uniref:ABC transporter permease n=1 Tax=Gottfriedia sp. NPDC056225 TaxID=3345751 RepID=UPI0035D7D02B